MVHARGAHIIILLTHKGSPSDRPCACTVSRWPPSHASSARGRLWMAEASIEAALRGFRSDLPVSCRSPKSVPPYPGACAGHLIPEGGWSAHPLAFEPASLRADGAHLPVVFIRLGGSPWVAHLTPLCTQLVPAARARRVGTVCMPLGRGLWGDRWAGLPAISPAHPVLTSVCREAHRGAHPVPRTGSACTHPRSGESSCLQPHSPRYPSAS